MLLSKWSVLSSIEFPEAAYSTSHHFVPYGTVACVRVLVSRAPISLVSHHSDSSTSGRNSSRNQDIRDEPWHNFDIQGRLGRTRVAY